MRYCVSLLLVGLLSLGFRCSGQALGADSQPLPIDVELDASMAQMDTQGSVYVPMDNWIYSALDRLHALGYIDTAYLGLRPWTRASIADMLARGADRIESDGNNDEARTIYMALVRELKSEIGRSAGAAPVRVELESVYTLFRGISGTALRDSFHLGQTIVNDYGRPYEGGFNNYNGFSVRAMEGRLSFYFRGEFQRAPSTPGYSLALAQTLSTIDDTIYRDPSTGLIAYSLPQATIPEGPISAANYLRVMEATLSFHLLGHEVSFGKDDHWLGPDEGASMLWGNNARDIYEFQINRAEPLRIPGLSRVTGPFRYDFFVGGLHGHTFIPNPAYEANPSLAVPNVINPGDPWVHMEKISLKPTHDLEFGFGRLTVWGGEGHAPITLHTFLHSFFSFQNIPVATSGASEKNGRDDPGYRVGTFDFTWRLPYLGYWVTLYTDSVVHDDVSPVSAPRRAGYHPGIYLARFPRFEHLDLRLEGANTEPASHSNSDGTPINQGQFLYWEGIQKQGPTNNGYLVGDWVGRQGKGGQAWLTYHLSPQEDLQFQYRRAKASAAFIPGGTTQNDFAVETTKRVRKDFELRGWLQYESWKAPIYEIGLHNDTTAALQVTWFPPSHE